MLHQRFTSSRGRALPTRVGSSPCSARTCWSACPQQQQQRVQQHTTCTAALAQPAQASAREEDSRANLLQFVQWAIQSKVVFAGVRPSLVDGVRGVYATFPLRAGDTVVAVPKQLALTVAPGERSPDERWLPQALWSGLPWFCQLALKLLLEKAKGSRSQYSDYLAVLPSAVDLPVLWPAEDVALLQYPYLQHKIEQEQQQWAQLQEQLAQPLAAKGLGPADLRWAMACVRSRSFAAPYFSSPFGKAAALFGMAAAAVGRASAAAAAPEVQYAIAPYIDMMNHSGAVQAECSFDPLSDQFKVAACRDVRAGQQVFINYGSQSNDQLLQVYGFVEEGNLHDRYVISDAARRLQVDIGSSGPVQLVVLSGQQPFPAETTSAAAQLLSRSAASASSPSGAAVKAALRAACTAELESLLSTLQEDEAELQHLRSHLEWLLRPPPVVVPLVEDDDDQQQQLQQQEQELHALPVTASSSEATLEGGAALEAMEGAVEQGVAIEAHDGSAVAATTTAAEAVEGVEVSGDGLVPEAAAALPPLSLDLPSTIRRVTILSFRVAKKSLLTTAAA